MSEQFTRTGRKLNSAQNHAWPMSLDSYGVLVILM